MSICSADCAQFDLTPNPSGGCQPTIRKRQLDKIGFYMCSTALPIPMTCENLAPLIANNSIVFTSSLANVSWADPTFDEVVITDCLPAIKYPTGRVLTAEDRIPIEIQAASGVTPNLFADYDFSKNKQEASFYLGYIFKYCDGTLEAPLDDNGNPLSGTFNIFRAYERQGSGATSYTMELKKMEINFKEDPLKFIPPLLDLTTCPDINI